MKRHIGNSIYGLLDYAAYPVGMLLIAPIVLRTLGIASYGIWTIAMAVANVGAIVASGFGDAIIRQVAHGARTGPRTTCCASSGPRSPSTCSSDCLSARPSIC